MGSKLVLDMDKIKIAAAELPGLISSAAELGVPIPKMVQAYSPMVALLAEFAGKFITTGNDEIFGNVNAETGPLGNGKRSYLRKSKSFTDEEVCSALAIVLSSMRKGGRKEQCDRLMGTINLTLDSMFPDVENHNATQTRAALDRVLNSESINADSSDKFGDILYFALTNKAKKEE